MGISLRAYPIKNYKCHTNQINVLQIINQTADPLELKDLAKKYQLLPRDASHLGIMRRNMIKNIATNDSDFERIKDLQVWIP